MNSNPLNHTTIQQARDSMENRDTFGILDSNGNRYKDIIEAFLFAKLLTQEDILPENKILAPDSFYYSIQMDSKTRRELKEKKEAKVLISFQTRKALIGTEPRRIAAIRLFEEARQFKIVK